MVGPSSVSGTSALPDAAGVTVPVPWQVGQ